MLAVNLHSVEKYNNYATFLIYITTFWVDKCLCEQLHIPLTLVLVQVDMEEHCPKGRRVTGSDVCILTIFAKVVPQTSALLTENKRK